MWLYQGFKTKQEANEFAKGRKHSRVVWEKNEHEKHGHFPYDYNDCVNFGMPEELLYVVIWEN